MTHHGTTIPRYKMISCYSNNQHSFNTGQVVTKFTINDAASMSEPQLMAIFDDIIDDGFEIDRQLAREPTHFMLHLEGQGLDNPIIIPARTREENTSELILNEIALLELSDKKADFLNMPITATVTTIAIPAGSGRPPSKHAAKPESTCLGKPLRCDPFNTGHSPSPRSFVPINNADNLCLFYAVEVGRLRHVYDYYRFSLLRKDPDWQRTLARNLVFNLGIPMDKKAYDLHDIDRVQKFYDAKYGGIYRIIVMNDVPNSQMRASVIYKGELNSRREFNIVLYLSKNHYTVLANPGLFLCGNDMKICFDCRVPYRREMFHTSKCPAKCIGCGRVQFGRCRDDGQTNTLCGRCGKRFFSQHCFDEHLKASCRLYHKCAGCKASYRTDKGHVCGNKFCKVCKLYHDPKRPCYIEPLKPPKSIKPTRIVVFDFETSQDTELSNGVNAHVVNFASVRWCCTACADSGSVGDEAICEVCATIEEIQSRQSDLELHGLDRSNSAFTRSASFSMYNVEEGKTVIGMFTDWVLTAFNQKYPTLVYSHNGGRFDEHFVVRELYARNLCPDLTMVGNKIYQMSVQNSKKHAKLQFRDSYLLLNAPLDALKGIFDLRDSVNKPFFPYLFNREVNKDVKLLRLPPPEDYIPQGMKPERFKHFMEWYDRNKYTPFSLRESLYSYGENDTRLLLGAMLKYREILKELTGGYDVLLTATTIAGVAMNIFKRCFLKADQLGIVPEYGYERHVKGASDVAIKYLEYYAKQTGTYIQHASNGGEHKIGPYKVDGFIPSENRAIEFLGCYFHGCKKCNMDEDICPNGKTAAETRRETYERLDFLRAHAPNVNGLAFELREVWECSVNQELKKNPEMKSFFDDVEPKGNIDPRDALFGGITNAYKMAEESDADFKISAFDIVSLYPWANFKGPYPLGHPNIITPKKHTVLWTNPEDIRNDEGDEIKGLLKVRITPPRGLYFPIIPFRSPLDKRLLFVSCPRCAKEFWGKNNKVFDTYKCKHTAEERSYTSTTTSLELKKALKSGYVVDRFYKGWHYNNWTTDEDNPFRDYIKALMKLKVENSDFPPGVITREQKEEFARDYLLEMGIKIDIDKVGLNKGMRYIAKLLLNSLWGKFAQRNRLSKTAVFTAENVSDYYALFQKASTEVTNIIFVSAGVIRVCWTEKKDFVRENANSNTVVALYTTAIARMRLLSYLDNILKQSGCTVLYTDTDSVMFKHPRNIGILQSGRYLGEMSEEYCGYEIEKFLAAGPKQYAMRLRSLADGSVRYVMKLRGITLDQQNAGSFGFEEFEKMIRKYPSEDEILAEYNKICLTPKSRVETKKIVKRYRCVNTKGLIASDLSVFPYGFK